MSESGTFSAELTAQLLTLMREGRKIEAIKQVREATGLGLAEAKDAVEQFALAHGMDKHGGVAPVHAAEFAPAPARVVEVPARLRSAIIELIGRNQKIEAIKLMRDKTNLGLKEAKDAVEAIERGESPTIAVPDHGEEPTPDLTRLSNEVMAILQRDGDVLAAIKRWREVTGSDLATAKNIVEHLRAVPAGTFTTAAPVPTAGAAPVPSEPRKLDFEEDIVSVLHTGSRKEAIHRYMALTGEDEDRARNAVDHLAMTNGIQKKGRCFIATACYGSYDAPEVRVLRRFRDERLAPSPAGAALVRLYYLLSPPIARTIAERPRWRRGVRRLLAPVVKMIGGHGNE